MSRIRSALARVRAWGSGASAALAALALAVLIAPLGVAATGDTLREGVRNGTSSRETEIVGRFNATASAKGGYVTRQSNTQTGPNAGGGAIYGCRGAAGGTASGSAPCLRASNLADGHAFELATAGEVGGLITLGDPAAPNPGKPFTTNATGVATGLNADKVDGLDAAQLTGKMGPPGPKGDKGEPGAVQLFAVVDGEHEGIVRGRGAIAFNEGAPDNGRVDIRFNRSLTDCAYIAGVSADGPPNPGAPAGLARVEELREGGQVLRVVTSAPDGTDAERAFHVIVTC